MGNLRISGYLELELVLIKNEYLVANAFRFAAIPKEDLCLSPSAADESSHHRTRWDRKSPQAHSYKGILPGFHPRCHFEGTSQIRVSVFPVVQHFYPNSAILI